MNQKNIALFTVSLSRGGAERVVSLLANNINPSIKIFLILLDKKIDYPLNNNIDILFLHKNFLRTSKFKQFILLPILAFKLQKICRQNQISSILSFLPIPNFINVAQKTFFKLKLKVIISERAFPSKYLKETKNYFVQTLNRFLIKILYNRADIIIPNSVIIKQDLQSNFGILKPQFQVIYNPIDATLFNSNFTRKEGSPFVFIHIGRFNKVKNHELLIRAFAKVKFQDAILILVGNGSLFGQIQKLVAELKLEGKIIFLGNRKFPELYLNSADCLVLTSLLEGFPNVILESLSCGLSVISTDCKSGPREILAPNTDFNFQLTNSIEETKYGYLIPNEREDLLVKTMELVIEKGSAKPYTTNATERVKSFNVDLIISKFENIL